MSFRIKVDVGSNSDQPIEVHLGDGFSLRIDVALRLIADLEEATKEVLYRREVELNRVNS